MASQKWQQVLLVDSKNTEALAGLARASKLRGDAPHTQQYLDRLRAINPNDPAIARVEGMGSQQDHNSQLQQAGKLAQQGQYAQSMNIYRQVYGSTPPPGDAALAYYETESATEEGRPHAIEGLHALAEKYPSDSRYQVALGRLLTYNPKTRLEGRRLLTAHPNDPEAVQAYGQALLFDVRNPGVAAEIRAFLARHNDPQLANAFRAQPRSVTMATDGGGGRPAVTLTPEQRSAAAARSARTADDQAAYHALNAHRLDDAEARFKLILSRTPEDPDALAGMGYIRMQQANFGGALSFLSQAKQDGSTDRGLEPAIATSRFWNTMGEGAIALNENNLPGAEKNYRAALGMRPASPEALEALGGTLLKNGQPAAAVPYFAEFVKVQPNAPHAWRGLLLAEYGAGNSPQALAVEHQMPGGVKGQLARDPLYLRGLASAYSSVGRDTDAQRVLKGALDLPFPADGKGLEADTQLQYAGLLQTANRLDQAAGLYRQVLAHDPNNTSAWEALVRVEHQMDQDPQAVQTLESMPPASYAQAMRDTGFEQTVASIYQSQRRYDVAGDLLEKALAQETTAGQKPSPPAQIQLAGIYLQRNSPQQAYPLYAQVLSANPGSTDAWKGLLSALHETGRDQEALAQVRQIPPATRAQLENDPDYLQTVGSVYNALGQPREAELILRRVQQHYAAQNAVPPADIDIQNAWLLYNAGSEQGLYRQLMVLGDRDDLSAPQRRTVQTIWSNLAVRRANQAADRGDNRRAIEILNADAQAFPDNPAVPKLLAAGYARAGAAKQAVAIWKAQDLSSASAADYKAAVGAALAAGDSKDAETWLRFGLEQYPKDSQMLTLAAKFEQARGDNGRAVEYYDAALDSMPKPDPGAELATELSHPGPISPQPRPSRPAQDLSTLLQPGVNDVTPGAPPVPPVRPPLYLPSYSNGAGSAPLLMNGRGTEGYGPVPMPATGMPSPGAPMQPANSPPQGTRSTLRDYVPQASAQKPAGGTGSSDRAVQYASQAEGSVPALIAAVYQHAQHLSARTTGGPADDEFASTPFALSSVTSWQIVAQQSGPAQSGQQRSGSQQSGSQQAGPEQKVQPKGSKSAPAAAGAPGPTGETYGPYVPYVPPAATSVRLGAQPVASPTQRPEVTDVLPRAKYVPNAHSDGITGSAHPDVEAADAAAVRRQQTRVAGRSGRSNPPADTITTTPTEPVQYLPYNPSLPPQTSQNGQVQTSQPSGSSRSLPAAQGTGVVPQGGMGDSNGQQYPQPNTRYTGSQPSSAPSTRGRARSMARRSGASVPSRAAAENAVPASQPGYQGMSYPGIQQPLTYQPYPSIGPAYPLGTPPSDYDLMQQRLPPLRGRYYTGNLPAAQVPLTERQQTERDLETLEASYSGWLGGTGSARYRSGTPGVDRLTDLETTVEASATVGNNVRFSVVPRAVFLNSGVLDTVDSTNTNPVLGTLPGNAANAPQQQFASGVGGEFQVATKNFAGAVGYTPYEFLVRNVTGRLLFRAGSHFTVFGDRSPVVETQLSYAGLRDPGSVTPVFAGNIWGGVISTGGGIRYEMGNERAGFYISADGADLSGYHVLENNKFEGSMGAYFLAHTFPGYGRLNVGASLFGMHYAHNERPLTYGLGGYFSPGAYFLASVPVSFTGRYRENFHYAIQGSVGVQTFQEDSQTYYPLDPGLQNGIVCTNLQLIAGTCGRTPVNSNTGGNYSVNSEGAYRIADHWYAGGFLSANNTNNYNTVTGGFFVRYLFRPQFGTEDYPTGLFPVEGFRPLRVP